MKTTIRKWLPNILLLKISQSINCMRVALNYVYDFRVYIQFSEQSVCKDIKQIEGKIIAHYHVLEKGLSHKKPKNAFSIPIARKLVELINHFDTLVVHRTGQVDVAVSVLKAYIEAPTNQGALPASLIKSIEGLFSSQKAGGGVHSFSRDKYFSRTSKPFDEFCLSRYSVRSFTDENVPIEHIIDAVKIAQKTPSVCNRQTCKVYVLTRKMDIMSHLSLQTGNRGFGQNINKLIVVVSDIRYFQGSRERNQAFVDGGMFGMTLLHALHFKNIGAVTLNWAYDKNQDKALHDLGIIPQYQKVIFFIGVGYPDSEFQVPVSSRRDVKEVVTII